LVRIVLILIDIILKLCVIWPLLGRTFNLFPGISKIDQKSIFAGYGPWDPLEVWKILLRGVALICPPDQHHSEKQKRLDFLTVSEQSQVVRARLLGPW
jgi:hypothetical protein